MIHSENTEVNLDRLAQFLSDGNSPIEFVTAGLEGMQEEGYASNDLQHRIHEEYQPTSDLDYINSADLMPVDPNFAQPPLSDLLAAKGNISLPETITTSYFAPKLEEHNNAGMDFELNLNPTNNGKNWYYSSVLQKVFIKLDKSFYIEVIYIPKALNEQLFLRAMMVYVNNPFSPVQRCQNHLHIDPSTDFNVKHNVLRSENCNVSYSGNPGGKNVNERLSVLIPLGYEKPDEHNQIKQSVALKFVCQNSCIGREPTAVIFTLENASTEILGKRIVNVKVCSCPKRDKMHDEKKFYETKKRENVDYDHPDKKPAKMMKIKEEPETPSPSLTSPLTAISSSPDMSMGNSSLRITLEFPNVFIVREVLKSAFNTVAGHMALNPEESEDLYKCCKTLKKLLDYSSKSSDKV